jgi:phosphopantetheine--protein transferase-like protein
MLDTDQNPVQDPPVAIDTAAARRHFDGTLHGVGIDAELVRRFDRLAADGRFWRRVCSPREAEHLASQAQPALALCAAFCCKEAFFKALGESCALPECECLHHPGATELDLLVSPRILERHGLGAARARFHERFLGERGECVVEVHLRRGWTERDEPSRGRPPGDSPAVGRVRSRLETLAVASVEAERRQIEEQHFSPEEIAALASRRHQSLAGSLALKRALAALWADAGCAAADPRDFVLFRHESGAPRLAAAPVGIPLADVSISISHTRQWAYGLAAIGRRVPAAPSPGPA